MTVGICVDLAELLQGHGDRAGFLVADLFELLGGIGIVEVVHGSFFEQVDLLEGGSGAGRNFAIGVVLGPVAQHGVVEVEDHPERDQQHRQGEQGADATLFLFGSVDPEPEVEHGDGNAGCVESAVVPSKPVAEHTEGDGGRHQLVPEGAQAFILLVLLLVDDDLGFGEVLVAAEEDDQADGQTNSRGSEWPSANRTCCGR